MLDKIKGWFKHSVTILWARIQVAAGVALATSFALLADPSTQDAIKAALPPQYMFVGLIAIGLITEMARRRTAKE